MEVTFLEIKDNGKRYKVTRRIPELHVAETKFYVSKRAALAQLKIWLKG